VDLYCTNWVLFASVNDCGAIIKGVYMFP
jgi:hypothetical protein